MSFLHKASRSAHKKLFVWVFFILSVVFFAYTVYVFYGEQIAQYISSTSAYLQKYSTEDAKDNESSGYTATGTIVFSATDPERLAEGRNISTNYQINVASPESEYERLFLNTNIDRWHFTSSDIDSGYLVYTDYEADSAGENMERVALFSVLDFEQPNFNINDFSSEGWYERHLSYSPEQDKLLFITQENEASNLGEFYYINNWQIQLLDRSAEERTSVTRGINPVWYKDTEMFLYLSQDGISSYNTITQENRLLLPTHREFIEIAGPDGSYTLTTEMAVSPDGNHLILTSPAENAIYFYSVYEEVSGLALERVAKMQAESGISYHNAVISPDSNYFAVLRADNTAAYGHSKAISIGSISEQSMLRTIDISEFSFESIIINGWK